MTPNCTITRPMVHRLPTLLPWGYAHSFLHVGTLAITLAACSSTGAAGPATGEIQGQTFAVRSAAIETNTDGSIEVFLTDYDDACASLAQGSKQNSADVGVSLPSIHVAVGDVYTVDLPSNGSGPWLIPGEAHVNFGRRDGTCSQTTDEYAETGTITITASAGAGGGFSGTVDAMTATNQVSGTFTVSCASSYGEVCHP
jgi:hypothetical protein